ncbi:MAG TPA: YdcF family protein [Edaphocola sp.]|nr:YdcF family protein [Edaphocola sp.]
MLTFLSALLINTGCVSMKKRPKRLYREVVERYQTFDALIVPGVPYNEFLGWGNMMRIRVLWSYFLYEKGIVKNIIYSGSAVYSPFYEAKIMGLYAQKLGIPESHIFYDTKAEHSVENVYYAYELARKEGFKSIALGTDPFQSSTLKRFTRRRFGSPIQHLPIVLDSLEQYDGLEITINPEPARKAYFKSLAKRQNIWQRTKGTFGGYIDWGKNKKKAEKL